MRCVCVCVCVCVCKYTCIYMYVHVHANLTHTHLLEVGWNVLGIVGKDPGGVGNVRQLLHLFTQCIERSCTVHAHMQQKCAC